MLLLTALDPWQLPSAPVPTSLTAAALGPYVAFLAHTRQDWDWELPAVTVPALACAVALLLRPPAVDALGPVPSLVGGAAALALALLALTAYAGNRELALAAAGSERSARRAARLQPWSAEPWRVRGEAQLERGRAGGCAGQLSRGPEPRRRRLGALDRPGLGE